MAFGLLTPPRNSVYASDDLCDGRCSRQMGYCRQRGLSTKQSSSFTFPVHLGFLPKLDELVQQRVYVTAKLKRPTLRLASVSAWKGGSYTFGCSRVLVLIICSERGSSKLQQQQEFRVEKERGVDCGYKSAVSMQIGQLVLIAEIHCTSSRQSLPHVADKTSNTRTSTISIVIQRDLSPH